VRGLQVLRPGAKLEPLRPEPRLVRPEPLHGELPPQLVRLKQRERPREWRTALGF
jgi:hypothetical protein